MEKLKRFLTTPVPRQGLWGLCLIVFSLVVWLGVVTALSYGGVGVVVLSGELLALLSFVVLVYCAARGVVWVLTRVEHFARTRLKDLEDWVGSKAMEWLQ